jgi:hypothetical protein
MDFTDCFPGGYGPCDFIYRQYDEKWDLHFHRRMASKARKERARLGNKPFGGRMLRTWEW